MVNITKVYTRTGDQGMTHLAGGKRISKMSLRIHAIGEVDELNALIGWVRVATRDNDQLEKMTHQLAQVQNELFNLGSQLAVLHEDRRENTPLIRQDDITRLEQEMDEMNEQLPALTSFILPGGGEIGARLHFARTVCRRAERALWALMQAEKLDNVELPYLNRLSDWLFVAARWTAKQLNEPETLWK